MNTESQFVRQTAIFALVFALVMTAAMQLQPMLDDWFFLNYFPSASERWSLDGYRWMNGCRLLPRDFWRPLEDMLLTAEMHHPWLFPGLNHALAVCGAFAAAAGVWFVARRLGAGSRVSFWAAVGGLLMANNAGALLSIDSITHTWAAAFGIWSGAAYMVMGRGRTAVWLATGLLAALSKETGVVFFVCGPVLRSLVSTDSATSISRSVRAALIGCIPAILFTAVYLILRDCNADVLTELKPYESAVTLPGMPPYSVRVVTPMHNNAISYIPTASVLIKNVFILFFAGIWPIDTTAILTGNKMYAAATALLGLGGPALVLMAWRYSDRESRRRSVVLLILTVVVALPSLLTRAGEISPFTSNTVLAIALSTLFKRIRAGRAVKIFAVAYAIAAAMTLADKYEVARRGGDTGREMAKAIASVTPPHPERVLLITRDETSASPGGAIFNRNPYKAFYHGAAVIHHYGYRYPLRLDKRIFESGYWNAAVADSIVRAEIGNYDCIWVTTGRHTTVYRKK